MKVGIETSSDRSYACFFCGTPNETDENNCNSCGKPLDVSSSLLGISILNYELVEFRGRGHYGFTFRATNGIGKSFAIKLTPKELYEARGKNFQDEITKFTQIGAHPNVAELYDANESVIDMQGQEIAVFFVIMEWVEGRTLSEFIEDGELDVEDLYSIGLDICNGLARFESLDLWHNDLNASNILIAGLSDDTKANRHANSDFIAKIVDIGSAVFRGTKEKKVLDDMRFLGRHFEQMRERILANRPNLTRENEFFLFELEKVVGGLLDEDPSRAITEVGEVVANLRDIYLKSHSLEDPDIEIRLDDPFSYLNANEFPSEGYINLLFSSQLPWLQAVSAQDQTSLLVTGPRGSGKTMILKNMRCLTRLYPHTKGEEVTTIRERISSDAFVGFFVSARLEIGNRCTLTKLPSWAQNEERVQHYFNLLYLKEVLVTIAHALRNEIFALSNFQERELCDWIARSLETGTLRGISQAITTVTRIQMSLTRDGEDVNSPHGCVGPTFLTELADQIRATVPEFRNKSVVYLLDDFSLPRVPETIQRALLPLIWNPGGGYSFRVSAHSESVVQIDNNNNTYVANREYSEILLGAAYIGSTNMDGQMTIIRDAVNDIFNKRFELSPNHPTTTLETLLGESSTESIASEIRRRFEDDTLRALRYKGWQTVIALCSGDISYVIDLAKRIYISGDPTAMPVSQDTQNREIRRYARVELYRLQDWPVGQVNLYEVALTFGLFSKFKLTKSNLGSDGRPQEYASIEVSQQNIDPRTKEAIAELLRNGVFVDGGFSMDSSGYIARKLFFRRLFTPVFPTTYVARNTWSMRPRTFSTFTNDPEAYLKDRIKKEFGDDDPQGTIDDLFPEL